MQKNLTSVTILSAKTRISYSYYGSFYGCNNLTIYGYTGSTAEDYAYCKSVRFVSLGSIPPLSITRQPKNASKYIGETAVFSIGATGNIVQYQWQFSRNNGRTWNDLGCTTSSYSVKAIAARNGYSYRCIVTEASGKQVISNVATLRIKLLVSTQPLNTTEKLGKWRFSTAAQVALDCNINGSVPTTTARRGQLLWVRPQTPTT